jgi:O-antigen/teichoic acid export membrane protein
LNPALASFGLDGVARTLAVLIVLLLFLFFPFRVIRYTMKIGIPILPEQSLLILFLLLIMVTPGFSMFSPYLFWLQYSNSLMFAKSAQAQNGTIFLGEVFAVNFFSRGADNEATVMITAIFTIIILVFGSMYFGLTVYFFGKPLNRIQDKH